MKEIFTKRRASSESIVLAFVLALILFVGCISSRCSAATIPRPLPVLMYHHIVADGQECNGMTVTAGKLEKDLVWLQENGYQTILPRDLAAGEPLPDKPVLITFDDGYRSNYEYLFPLLKKYDMKAVISIITARQDCGHSGYLSWDMCREMTDSGLVEIGSHTYDLHNPALSGNFDPDGINGIQRDPAESNAEFENRVLMDLKKSYDRIEEELGCKPTFFAYPFGVVEPDARDYLGQLFPVTVTSVYAVADLTNGLCELPRLTVTMDTDLAELLEY